jgi:hypothetical protein
MRDRLTVFARAAGSHLAYSAVLAVLMLGALFLSALASGHTVPESLDGFYRGLYMLLAFRECLNNRRFLHASVDLSVDQGGSRIVSAGTPGSVALSLVAERKCDRHCCGNAARRP